MLRRQCFRLLAPGRSFRAHARFCCVTSGPLCIIDMYLSAVVLAVLRRRHVMLFLLLFARPLCPLLACPSHSFIYLLILSGLRVPRVSCVICICVSGVCLSVGVPSPQARGRSQATPCLSRTHTRTSIPKAPRPSLGTMNGPEFAAGARTRATAPRLLSHQPRCWPALTRLKVRLQLDVGWGEAPVAEVLGVAVVVVEEETVVVVVIVVVVLLLPPLLPPPPPLLLLLLLLLLLVVAVLVAMAHVFGSDETMSTSRVSSSPSLLQRGDRPLEGGWWTELRVAATWWAVKHGIGQSTGCESTASSKLRCSPATGTAQPRTSAKAIRRCCSTLTT